MHHDNDKFRREFIQALPAGEQRLLLGLLVEWADEDGAVALDLPRRRECCEELHLKSHQLERLLSASQREGWLTYRTSGEETVTIQLK